MQENNKKIKGYLLLLVILFGISTIGFAALAVRNARVLDCHSYETDKAGNSYCRIWIGWESPEE